MRYKHDFNFTDYCIKCKRSHLACIDKRGMMMENCIE